MPKIMVSLELGKVIESLPKYQTMPTLTSGSQETYEEYYVEKKRRKLNEIAKIAKERTSNVSPDVDNLPLALRSRKTILTNGQLRHRKFPSKAEQKMFPSGKSGIEEDIVIIPPQSQLAIDRIVSSSITGINFTNSLLSKTSIDSNINICFY